MGDYIQQQEDEVVVLQSIFGDDYVPITPGAQFEVFIFLLFPTPTIPTYSSLEIPTLC
jgi:hypothetical protein